MSLMTSPDGKQQMVQVLDLDGGSMAINTHRTTDLASSLRHYSKIQRSHQN